MTAAAVLLALQPLRFVVQASPSLVDVARDGRVFVVVARDGAKEPRKRIGATGMDVPLVVALDVAAMIVLFVLALKAAAPHCCWVSVSR